MIVPGMMLERPRMRPPMVPPVRAPARADAVVRSWGVGVGAGVREVEGGCQARRMVERVAVGGGAG